MRRGATAFMTPSESTDASARSDDAIRFLSISRSRGAPGEGRSRSRGRLDLGIAGHC
jgi:hypothetical protein